MARAEPIAGNPEPRAAWVVTVSDRCHRGETQDESGPALAARLSQAGFEISGAEIVPDDRSLVAGAIRRAAERAHLVVTTGGTGLGPRDLTPEATRDVIDVEVPGLGERMRAESARVTPHAVLSRALAGLRGRSLVLNLPGSRRGALENLEAVLPALGHALDVAQGRVADCGRTPPGKEAP